ncbi:CHAP domain-containing protein [Weissella confusa]|uniref:phage tail tip lysozyme n=1 Tax=Weissella confusa TaxID=1583 RepID=UPI001C6FB2DD|nr:phage tail tip lysozyme [Weissella confusa]QYU58852.1 CHAP domain-containing protein [Weissella confusa]
MMGFSGQSEKDCTTQVGNTTAASGTATGNWKDANSQEYKNMQYAITVFKNEGFSGNNIAAILAIGDRESGFNPKAVNPSGAVKGVFQWGAGGINGNRYGNTADTIEAQMSLAITELNTGYISAKGAMLAAKSIEDSLVAWDTKYEGLSAGDSQRKVSQITANANAIKDTFKLDFAASSEGNSPLKQVANDTTAAAADQATTVANNLSCPTPNQTTGQKSGAATQQMPAEYKGKVIYPDNRDTTYPDNKYPFGQCTWYVYNRIKQIGKSIDWFSGDNGNGGLWPIPARAAGYTVEDGTPHAGWAVSFDGGEYGAVAPYGHIAFVEYVNDDGSFLVSEANVVAMGTGTVSYRVIPNGKGLTFIEPK